jgi:hypothetical protein
MAYPSQQFCLRCSSPIEIGQRFCTHCGSTLDRGANSPTAVPADRSFSPAGSPARNGPPLAPAFPSEEGPTIVAPDRGPTPLRDASASPYAALSGGPESGPHPGGDSVPPPPPPLPASPFAAAQYASSSYSPPAPGASTVPPYTRAPQRSKAGLFAIVALLVLLGGVGGYVLFFQRPASSTTSSNQHGTSTVGQPRTPGTGGSGPAASPTASAPNTEQVHLTFTYASDEITLTSVQQAPSFPDDSATPGGVRLTLSETNRTSARARFVYSDVAHLLLPDGTLTAVSNALAATAPDPATSRTNWLDFAVSAPISDLSQLVLRMGTPTDHQMDIPLKPGADLSAFQPRTITPNTPISYGGLHWTLLGATLSLSANGVQATAGMRYLTLSLRVDNPTTQDVGIGFPTDYLRLKSREVTSAPTDTTLPLKIMAGTTGVTGTVLFLMPESDTTFTLEWLAHANPVYDPVSPTQVNTPIAFL